LIEKLTIEHSASILSKYYQNAKDNNKEKAIKELTAVMRTFQKLVLIAKEYSEIQEGNP